MILTPFLQSLTNTLFVLAQVLGQGTKTLSSPVSLCHRKTLSFHDHALKTAKDVPSGLQNNPTATTAIAVSQVGDLLDGTASVRWMGVSATYIRIAFPSLVTYFN